MKGEGLYRGQPGGYGGTHEKEETYVVECVTKPQK